jgi:hypothetical protein
MALTEKKIIDLIEVLSGNSIQVRESIVLLKDNEEISKQYQRYTITPNSDLSEFPDRVRAIATAAWENQEVILSEIEYSAT